ncbi:MAG TPA: hypothetical protein VEA78_09760, partial [Acidimicrobiales bacterium]|nr:hypothetical protein [Acidimicrobiales bacterium]
MAHEENEWRIREDRRRMQKREAEVEAKENGTYWCERDGRRTAKQSTHVLVDPDAWQAMKDEARRQGTSVGELVGMWVGNMPAEPDWLGDGQVQDLTNRAGKVPLIHMVSRIDVHPYEWGWAKSDAAKLGVTIARYVGLTVEAHT